MANHRELKTVINCIYMPIQHTRQGLNSLLVHNKLHTTPRNSVSCLCKLYEYPCSGTLRCMLLYSSRCGTLRRYSTHPAVALYGVTLLVPLWHFTALLYISRCGTLRRYFTHPAVALYSITLLIK